jgi:hypothetical protein
VTKRLTEVGVPSTGFDWTIEELRRRKNILRARVFASETATWAPVLDAVMSIAPAVLALVADHKGVIIATLHGLRYPVIDLPPAPTDHGKTGMSEADADRLASMSATVFGQRPMIDALVEHLLEALKVLSASEPGQQASGGESASDPIDGRPQHEPSVSSIRTHTLRVPGARLHHKVYDDGPTLLLVPAVLDDIRRRPRNAGRALHRDHLWSPWHLAQPSRHSVAGAGPHSDERR